MDQIDPVFSGTPHAWRKTDNPHIWECARCWARDVDDEGDPPLPDRIYYEIHPHSGRADCGNLENDYCGFTCDSYLVFRILTD